MRHLLAGLFRESVFERLAGYEDVNDDDHLAYDPAMRAVVNRFRICLGGVGGSEMPPA